MLGRLAGHELLMGSPCWDMPWFPYMSIRLAGTGIWRHRGEMCENRSDAGPPRPIAGMNKCARHRVGHLQPRIHQAQHVVTVTGLQANDVIDDIIHLGAESHVRSNLSLRKTPVCKGGRTSFSQLAFKDSKAIGLLGALLPGPGGMPPWSEDWLWQGKLNTCEPSLPR